MPSGVDSFKCGPGGAEAPLRPPRQPPGDVAHAALSGEDFLDPAPPLIYMVRSGWRLLASRLVADDAFASAVMLEPAAADCLRAASQKLRTQNQSTLLGRLLPGRAEKKSPYSNPESC